MVEIWFVTLHIAEHAKVRRPEGVSRRGVRFGHVASRVDLVVQNHKHALADRLLAGLGTFLGAVERLFRARTGNNRAKTSISAIFGCQFPAYQTRAHARQVSRARADSPNAVGGTI